MPTPDIRILETLGPGPYGPWSRAIDLRSGVEVLSCALIDSSPAAMVRRREQMGRAADVRHPFVARPLELIVGDDGPQLIFEAVDGLPLDQLLQSTAVPVRVGVELVRKVARALFAAWDRVPAGRISSLGVLHGALSPAHIWVARSGQVRVVGLWSTAADRPAATGGVYEAPEAVSGPLSHASDVYSLGAILGHLLTGMAPDPAGPEIAEHGQRIASLAEMVEEISQDPVLATLITRSMAWDPGSRPGAVEVEALLDQSRRDREEPRTSDWCEAMVPKARALPRATPPAPAAGLAAVVAQERLAEADSQRFLPPAAPPDLSEITTQNAGVLPASEEATLLILASHEPVTEAQGVVAPVAEEAPIQAAAPADPPVAEEAPEANAPAAEELEDPSGDWDLDAASPEADGSGVPEEDPVWAAVLTQDELGRARTQELTRRMFPDPSTVDEIFGAGEASEEEALEAGEAPEGAEDGLEALDAEEADEDATQPNSAWGFFMDGDGDLHGAAVRITEVRSKNLKRVEMERYNNDKVTTYEDDGDVFVDQGGADEEDGFGGRRGVLDRDRTEMSPIPELDDEADEGPTEEEGDLEPDPFLPTRSKIEFLGGKPRPSILRPAPPPPRLQRGEDRVGAPLFARPAVEPAPRVPPPAPAPPPPAPPSPALPPVATAPQPATPSGIARPAHTSPAKVLENVENTLPGIRPRTERTLHRPPSSQPRVPGLDPVFQTFERPTGQVVIPKAMWAPATTKEEKAPVPHELRDLRSTAPRSAPPPTPPRVAPPGPVIKEHKEPAPASGGWEASGVIGAAIAVVTVIVLLWRPWEHRPPVVAGRTDQPAESPSALVVAPVVAPPVAADPAVAAAKQRAAEEQRLVEARAAEDARLAAARAAEAKAEESRRVEEARVAEEARQAKVAADARAVADAKARAEADAKARADAKSRAEADAKARADAKSRAEADAKARADAKSRADAESRAAVAAKAQADAKAAADAKARADAKAAVDAKTRADADAKARAAKAQAEAKAQVAADAKVRAAADAKARAEAQAAAKAQAEARAKAVADAKARGDTRSGTRTPPPTPAAVVPTPPARVAAGTLAIAGDAQSVRLVGGGQSVGAGEVPVGSYEIRVVYEAGAEPVVAGNVSVADGQRVTVRCSATFLRCDVR